MNLFINFIIALPQIYNAIKQIQKSIDDHNKQMALERLNAAKSMSESVDATKKFVDSL